MEFNSTFLFFIFIRLSGITAAFYYLYLIDKVLSVPVGGPVRV